MSNSENQNLKQDPVASVQVSGAAPVKVVFYCKDCRKLVAGVKVGNKYVYKCPACSTKNVAFGTEKSIKSFYHVAG